MSNENPIKQQENKKKALLRFVESRVKNHFGYPNQEFLPAADAKRVYLNGLDRLKTKLIETIPEQEEGLARLFESFTEYPMDDEDSLVAAVSEKLTEFIAANYTYEDIERISRNNPRYKNIELNRLVVFGITVDEVHLHVPITFIENPAELATLFVDAMKKLAVKLKSDPELAEIKKITAESWIVAKAQKTLIKYGFTVTDIDPQKESGKAEISREKLLELYGE